MPIKLLSTKLEWDDEFSYEIDKEIERVAKEIAEEAHNGNDNELVFESIKWAKYALDTALYNKTLIKSLAIKYGFIDDDR